MSLMPFADPLFPELGDLKRTLDRLSAGLTGRGSSERGSDTLGMPVNLSESDDAYEVQAPVAGFRPEEVDVSFQDGVLTIKAEHKQEQESQQGQSVRREFLFANAVRRLSLGNAVDPAKIEAKIEHGMLTVTMPKAPQAQARRIEIKAGESSAQLPGKS